MPDLVRLAHDLDRLRSSHGSEQRRTELRERLNGVDPELRRQRNIERLRLTDIKARLRGLDTRCDPGALQAAAVRSAQRLIALDQEIIAAMAASEAEPVVAAAPARKTLFPSETMSPRQDRLTADGCDVLEARAALLGRLLVASSLLGGSPLPDKLVDQLQAALDAQIARLTSRGKAGRRAVVDGPKVVALLTWHHDWAAGLCKGVGR